MDEKLTLEDAKRKVRQREAVLEHSRIIILMSLLCMYTILHLPFSWVYE